MRDQEKTCIIYGNHTTEKSFSRKCKKYENNKETIQTKQARIQYKKNIPGGGYRECSSRPAVTGGTSSEEDECV